MPSELLLLEDVDDLGRSGDIVNVKPGYARNFLLPKRKAVFADANAKRMQARLQAERAKQAAEDKKQAEEMAERMQGLSVATIVKVDHEGHMYGSVSAVDLVKFLEEKGFEVEKRQIQLPHPIKATGVHTIKLKLKENVASAFVLKVIPEGMDEASFDADLIAKKEQAAKAKAEKEAQMIAEAEKNAAKQAVEGEATEQES